MAAGPGGCYSANFFMAARYPCCWKAAALLAGLCLAGAATAEPAVGWSKRVWQTDDGLPAANVTGIAQTRDGYLWLATQSGLARFDGVQFEDTPIPGGRARPILRAMLCDHAEHLWLAEDGGVVVRFGAGGSRLFTSADGLPDALPLQLVETPDQSVWITYANGAVHRITPDNKVKRFTAADGLPDDGLCSLAVDSRGVLWFAMGLQFGNFHENHFHKTGALPQRNAQILGGRNGGIWICLPGQLLKLDSNAAPVVLANFEGDANRLKPSVLFEDVAGRLWIGTVAGGLFQFDGANLFQVETSQNNIRTIAGDREGNIWVGTDGGGLDRLNPSVVELHGRDEGLPFETVRSLCEDKTGDLWIVTQDGALTRVPHGNWGDVQPIENWPGGQAHCIAQDKAGAIWIGTRQRGLYCWKDGRFSRFGLQNGLAGLTIRSLLADHHNDLWVGLETEHLVQRLHDGQFQSFKQPANSRAVRAMAEDSTGQVWMGTLDGRLLRMSGDQLSEVAQPAAESSHPIRCLSATPDGNLWIGYAAHGVCRLRAGTFSHIGRANGLFDGNICALMPDGAGRMWFGSDRGIFYVTLGQMNDFADGRAKLVQSIFFGRDAGLPSLQAYYGYWPGALRTQAGEILFPTHSGIAAVYPERVHANLTPPNVIIQGLEVDGQKISLAKRGGAPKIPPNHRRIEVTFTAPSFISPEQVRFRYRLAGWNEEWSDPDAGRTAVFSRLPPGAYTFQVAACNSFGVWNAMGESFRFRVMPFFWQGWPFRLLAALVFTGAVVALARHLSLRRVRLMLKQAQEEAALQKERTRIAQDMHDELGARFTQISLLGELSRHALPEPDKARDFLGQISRAAQAGVKSLDEIVWAVNPRNDTLSDLLDYTGQYALDFLASAGLQCALDFPDNPPPREIPGDIRHAVFLIVKEALHNVVKHAHATRVKISFAPAQAELLWRIEDDGRGFEPARDNALADGLRNIRQRAAVLGGKVEIDSRPGAGTRVSVQIPLRR
jgi:signal transduction histidine kinase/ligand-binding sensor domain-containing protein